MPRYAIAEPPDVVKPQRGQLLTLQCPVCKKPFTQARWWQKQCSTRCTDRAYKMRMIERLREEIREEFNRSGGRNGS